MIMMMMMITHRHSTALDGILSMMTVALSKSCCTSFNGCVLYFVRKKIIFSFVYIFLAENQNISFTHVPIAAAAGLCNCNIDWCACAFCVLSE